MKIISVSVFCSVIISLALFWLMQFMISNNQQGFKETKNLQMTEFVRLKRETKIQIKQRNKPDEPPPEKKRPPPPTMQMQRTQVRQAPLPQMDMPHLDIPLQSNRFDSLLNGLQVSQGNTVSKEQTIAVSTHVIPLVRIPPQYPKRAVRRRIEGWVKIEFTITLQGTVKEPKVIEAQPSRIFNREALRAIKRWKFKAKMSGGQAVEQRAVQILQFKLAK